MNQENVSKEEVVVSKGTTPAYKGDGVSVWENVDKNGKPYLAISIVGMKPIHAFKYEGKKQGGDEE